MTEIRVHRTCYDQLQVTQTTKKGGTILTEDELVTLIQGDKSAKQEPKYDFEKESKPGFADFVRILEIHEEDLKFFLQAVRKKRPEEMATVEVVPRHCGEVAVPTVTIHGPKTIPKAARLILYSHEQLDVEGEAPSWDSDWEVVSINCGPAEETMNPYTIARNYFASRDELKANPRAIGGSPHFTNMTDSQVLKLLLDAMYDWADKGTADGTSEE